MLKTNKFLCFLLLLPVLFSIHKLQANEYQKIKLSNGALWVKSSDEYKLCTYQSYINAAENLKKILEDEKNINWCVVMDIDDTILSTVNHIITLEAKGENYSDKEWMNWYKRDEAFPVPGAIEFTETVQNMGGKVILVSNTQGCLKENTLMKLKKYGINYDICLVREGPYEKDSNKLLRMKDIEEGNIKNPEYEHIPAQHIIMKIGDSSHDLYDIKKYTFKDVKNRIGRDLIIIPNPMYGNWSDSPEAYVEAKNNDTIPVTVKEGNEFTITLASNPSTGYKWDLNEIDETKVTFISCKYAKTDSLLPGSGEKEIWTLKALKKGKTVISFKYARPWEKDEFSSEEKSFFILIK